MVVGIPIAGLAYVHSPVAVFREQMGNRLGVLTRDIHTQLDPGRWLPVGHLSTVLNMKTPRRHPVRGRVVRDCRTALLARESRAEPIPDAATPSTSLPIHGNELRIQRFAVLFGERVCQFV